MNKINITIPEGFEIDQQKSDLAKGVIEFKPVEKKLTYEDVAKELFKNKKCSWINSDGEVATSNGTFIGSYNDPNNATSKEQLECLMAYNKLRNVAEYLNAGLIFNKNSQNEQKWYLYYNINNKKIVFAAIYSAINSDAYFASRKLAEQAIEILGEEEIKKALFIY